jgi:hypothetical protein
MWPVPNRNEILAIPYEPLGLAQILADCGLEEWDYEVGQIRVVVIRVPEGEDPDAALARLRAHPGIESADFHARLPGPFAYHHSPSDPLIATGSITDGDRKYDWALTWALTRANIYGAWRHGRGSPLIKIGDIDEGWLPHADLPTPDPANLYNAVTQTYGDATTDPTSWNLPPPLITGNSFQPHGHGLMTSSAIWLKHDGSGAAGVAPDTTPVFAGFTQSFEIAKIVAAVTGVVDAGANICNCSWGGYGASTADASWYIPSKKAIDYALERGALVVAAAGNSSLNFDTEANIWTPVELPGVLSVGAYAAWGGKSGYSNYGSTVDTYAPTNVAAGYHRGRGTASPWGPSYNEKDQNLGYGGLVQPNSLLATHWSGNGTSISSPFWAAAAGLVWSQDPPVWPPGMLPKDRRSKPNLVVGSITNPSSFTIDAAPGDATVAVNLSGARNFNTPVTVTINGVAGPTPTYPNLSKWAVAITGRSVGDVITVTNGTTTVNVTVAPKNQIGGFTAEQVAGFLLSTVSPFFNASAVTMLGGVNRWGYPRGVLNAAKAVLAAKAALLPQDSGVVYPYVGFIGEWYCQDDPSPQEPHRLDNPGVAGTQSVWSRRAPDGSVRTRLNGNVLVELTGYSGADDPVTRVALTVGGVVVYDGPPTVLSVNTDDWPQTNSITVEAWTQTGAAASESYSDVYVRQSWITADAGQRVNHAVTMRGWRRHGAPVSVSCPTASVGPVSYPTESTWEAVLSGMQAMSNVVTASDGVDVFSLSVEDPNPLTPVVLSGAAGGHAAGGAPPSVEIPITGAADGRAAAAAPNPANPKLAASAGGHAAGSATIQAQPPISAAAGGQGGASATLSFPQPSATRRVVVSAADGSEATFATRAFAIAAIDGTSLGFGIAPTGYYGPALELAGAAAGHAGATAVPGVIQGLAGTASGHAAAQGAIPAQGLGGDAAGHAGAAGTLTQQQHLAGEAGGAAGAQATGPQVPIALAGEAAGQASASADANKVALRGAAEGNADVGTQVTQDQPLAGVAEGHASVTDVQSVPTPGIEASPIAWGLRAKRFTSHKAEPIRFGLKAKRATHG